MSDEPKSAIELAMERLRQKDLEAGVEEKPLSDEQRAAIAEVRQVYEAKVAELEILHRSKLARVRDLAEHDEAERDYRRDRERLNSERDTRIEKLRND